MTGGVVVIGVGNRWRRDDGAGPEVARRLASRLGPDVAVHELDGEPARLVEAWDGATLAVLVDAVRTGAAPGTLERVELDRAPSPAVAGSSHALGLVEAVRLGRALGRLPDRMVLIGIEVADVGRGVGLTGPVEAAVAEAVEGVATVVAATLRGRAGGHVPR